MAQMTLLQAIKTLREVQGLSFDDAIIKAVQHFRDTGREVNTSMQRMYERAEQRTR